MTVSKTGAYFFLEYGEVANIKVPHKYENEKSGVKTYSKIGEKQWIHIPKVGGTRPTVCPGKDTCELCKAGNMASIQYKLSVMFEGTEYYMNMQKSLGDMIIERQKMLYEMGLSDEEVMATTYRVGRLAKGVKPYWEVVPVLPKKEDVAKAKAVSAQTKVVDLDELEAEEDKASVAGVVLTAEDVQAVERYKVNIKKRCDEAKGKGEVFDFRPSLEAGLKKLGWSDAKIVKAQTLYDNDGVFTKT